MSAKQRNTLSLLCICSMLVFVAGLALWASSAYSRADSEIQTSPLTQHIADQSADGMGKKVWRVGDPVLAPQGDEGPASHVRRRE